MDPMGNASFSLPWYVPRLVRWIKALQGEAQQRLGVTLADNMFRTHAWVMLVSKSECSRINKDKNLSPLEDGNCLCSRSLLLCLLATALDMTWMIEQPASSRIIFYPRFEQLIYLQNLQVYSTGWWGRLYGALTPCLGNNETSCKLCWFGLFDFTLKWC